MMRTRWGVTSAWIPFCRGAALSLGAALVAITMTAAEAESVHDPDALAWPPLTSQCRPWAYWWWMGSAVDPVNLTRELTRYRDAGLGGIHIIPIYGAKGWEDRYIEFLSPKWMEMLDYTVREAHRLGLGVDMTTGTGWCFGGPTVAPTQGGMRATVKVYNVPAGGALKAKLDRATLLALVAYPPEGQAVDLTDRVTAAGGVDWKASGGACKVYAVSWKSTRLKVKRAAPGGEGLMLNPFYGEAMRAYLVRFTDAFAAYQGSRPRSMYHDSYEYSSDWSPDLFAEFEKRRGYRLQTQLPLFFGTEKDDRTARVKGDYRATISDLMVERFAPAWVGWAHQQGFVTRYEAHGSPANLLDLYAVADIPETEMFHKERDPLISKFASSAAHVSGKNLTSSESGTWLAEHFTETLAELKREMDEFFVSGVNHVFYHGTCYSPDEAGWPGWVFYASTEMNPRNSIWRDTPALNAYLARCQSVLQTGQPDNDILLYWPIHDLWHQPVGGVRQLVVFPHAWLDDQAIGALARQLWQRGYGFDYVSDRQLGGATARAGGIQVPGGRYRTVIVPATEHMPLETLRQLLALADGGCTIIFQEHLPPDVPGLGNLEQRRDALQKALATVKLEALPGGKLRRAKVGQGRVVVGDVEAALALAGIDRETVADHPRALFIRRAADFGHQYFIANHGDQALDRWITLAVAAESVALMDPMTGRVGLAAVRQDGHGHAQIYLQVQPGASILVRAFTGRKVHGPAWSYQKLAGEPVPLTGTWQVTFIEGGPKLPQSFQTDRLASWTTRDDAEAKRFAGTARYTITFDAPGKGERFLLDLGTVCQSARVRLNGCAVGTLLVPPFRTPLEGVKPRGNVLEVEVTNVSANRIRDLDRRHVHWKNFHDINFVNIDYKPFDASNWPLYDSGLLGPVTLQAIENHSPP